MEVPAPSVVPIASPSTKGKKTETEPRSRAASSEPASQRSGKKKEKVPIPKLKELEEEEESIAEDTTELEEEEVPSTPLPDQKIKGKGDEVFKQEEARPYIQDPFAPKCQSKTLVKGEGSNYTKLTQLYQTLRSLV